MSSFEKGCQCNICRAKREGIDPTLYCFAPKHWELIKANPGKSVIWYTDEIARIEAEKK